MQPRIANPPRTGIERVPVSLPVPLAAGLFGALLASVCAFFGWVAHFPHASAGQLLLRIPATLVCGLPFYAAAGYLFARWIETPPYPLSELKGFGRLPVLLAFGVLCGGLRWFVTAADDLVHFLHGERAPIGAVSLFLLLPQVLFSALLATAAFAYPAFRLDRVLRESENWTLKRLPARAVAVWGAGAWVAAFVATIAFESGAGALVPSLVAKGG